MRAKHSIAVLLLLIAWRGASVLKAADDRFLNLASQSTLPQGRRLAARFDADSGIVLDPPLSLRIILRAASSGVYD